jgi:hypothetical protein
MISQRKIAAALRAGAAVLLLGSVAAVQPATAADGAGGTKPAAPVKRIFNYFLPRTELTVEVSQQLTACPASGEEAGVETTITITPTRDADPEGHVLLDAGSGTWAKRTVKLEINPDGTLASFNSESEGQGGPVLKSIAKLAFDVAASGFPLHVLNGNRATPSGALVCNKDTQNTFDAIATLTGQIAKLEANVIASGGDAAVTVLLNDLRARRAQRRASLTLKTSIEDYAPLLNALPATLNETTATNLFKVHVPAIDYRPWFGKTPPGGGRVPDVPTGDISFPGAYGFLVALTPDHDLYTALHAGDGTKLGKTPTPNLVYRLAVPASVVVAPCADAAKEKCLVDTTDDGKLASFGGSVSMTQLSGLYSIRTGRGGLFGTRAATAKFDANGVPSALEYGSTSASADLAGLVDTAGEGIGTLRDAELSKLKRQIELEEARQKLDELRSGTAADEE